MRASVTPIFLPGQHFDLESGWNQNGFRDYAQDWGRYLETDPKGLRGGVNTYVYALSNPFVFLDRRGECPCEGTLEEAPSPLTVPTNVQNALGAAQDVGIGVLSLSNDSILKTFVQATKLPLMGLGTINATISGANLAQNHSFRNAFDFVVSVGSIIPDSPIASFSFGMSVGKATTYAYYWLACETLGQGTVDDILSRVGNALNIE
jgi:RHS repeat-associated protein